MDVSANIDDHIHCLFCYKFDCVYNKCAIIDCSQCKVRLHTCKVEDHLLLCRSTITNCPNRIYGCCVQLRRYKISAHLPHCCASIIFCGIQWNRRVLNESAKRKMKRTAKGLDKPRKRPHVDSQEIDLCAAIVDQETLFQSYRTTRSDRKRLIDNQNPCHPMLPLRCELNVSTCFADEDSSDEENKLKQQQLKKKRSPFEGCYLCRTDPSSQHLHTLGNYSFTQAHDEVCEVKELKITLLPEFYQQRNLFIDINKVHLSPFARKDETLPYIREGSSAYTFICNENYRRDEYSNHYELVHMESDEIVARCPFYTFGCPFYYHQKKPKHGTLRFNHYISNIAWRPLSHVQYSITESVLCSLPYDMMVKILSYLDSASLRCLSSTNRALRQFCFQYLLKSAMVHIKWEKSEMGMWMEKCFVWEFSKCQERVREWTKISTSAISNHLYECNFGNLLLDDARKPKKETKTLKLK